MPRWAQDDPKFQRTLQKMAAMSPESKAIFNASAAEGAWAVTDAAKNLRLMQISNDLKNRKKSFEINMDYKRAGLDYKKKKLSNLFAYQQGQQHLTDKALRSQKRQDKYGNILGVLNLGVTGVLGSLKNKQNLRQANRTNNLLERILNNKSNK